MLREEGLDLLEGWRGEGVGGGGERDVDYVETVACSVRLLELVGDVRREDVQEGERGGTTGEGKEVGFWFWLLEWPWWCFWICGLGTSGAGFQCFDALYGSGLDVTEEAGAGESQYFAKDETFAMTQPPGSWNFLNLLKTEQMHSIHHSEINKAYSEKIPLTRTTSSSLYSALPHFDHIAGTDLSCSCWEQYALTDHQTSSIKAETRVGLVP